MINNISVLNIAIFLSKNVFTYFERKYQFCQYIIRLKCSQLDVTLSSLSLFSLPVGPNKVADIK